jgi:hypothetical protein
MSFVLLLAAWRNMARDTQIVLTNLLAIGDRVSQQCHGLIQKFTDHSEDFDMFPGLDTVRPVGRGRVKLEHSFEVRLLVEVIPEVVEKQFDFSLVSVVLSFEFYLFLG